MYKLHLALRYLRKRRITYFAVLSVALCVAMVIVVHGVMGGFLEAVKQSSRRLLGDVILEIGSMSAFPYYDEFIERLHRDLPDTVAAATPVIFNAGLATLQVGSGDQRTFPVQVTGIRLPGYRSVNAFGEGLFYDRLFPSTTSFAVAPKPLAVATADGRLTLPDAFERARAAVSDPEDVAAMCFSPSPDGSQHAGTPAPGIILGAGLVSRIGSDGRVIRDVPVGTLVRLTVLPYNREGGAGFGGIGHGQKVALRYVDDSRTRVHEVDSQAVYCDFDLLQDLLELGRGDDRAAPGIPRASQIQIKLQPGADIDQARARIRDSWDAFLTEIQRQVPPGDFGELGWVNVKTWLERNAGFIRAIEKQHVLVLIMLAVISLVAIVLVGCTFYMIVQERTREIGIVKSMGASASGVAGMFLAYAACVGVTGALLGVVVGLLFAGNINEFQALIADIHPSLQIWNPSVYSFERIPQNIRALDAILICVIAVGSAMLGAMVAAWRAARVWPVQALRYE